VDIIFAAVFGLIIGSFLNVCIWRIPRHLSLVSPARSFCPKCKTQLSWLENIPLISWSIQSGRCRTCRESISGQYPLVEALSGFGAAASYLHYGFTVSGLIVYALTATLIVITFIDFEFKLIPNVITFPGITMGLWLGVIYNGTNRLDPQLTQGAFDSLVGMLAGGGFFYLIGTFYYMVARRVGLGGGDINLMALVGAVLGWRSIAPTVFAGAAAGAVIGIIAMIVSGKGRRTEIPFGPWLSLGALLYLFADLPFFRLP
jgi:leader peptidase (prepilin peptidase) / N-methyltransferase